MSGGADGNSPTSGRTSRAWSRALGLRRRLEAAGLPAPILDAATSLDAVLGWVEAAFRGLFVENPQPMWVLDAETGGFIAVNRAAVAEYGYTAEEFAGLSPAALRHDPGLNAAQLAVARVQRSTVSTRHRRKDGRLIDVEVIAGPLDFLGRRAILSVIHNVTERNRLERQLRNGDFRDPVTGGPNRALFLERVAHALTRLRRHYGTIAVLVCGINGFADVRNGLGYTIGDSLLQEVATRLATAVRPGDTVARLVGDEFGVLLEDIGDRDRAIEAAERLSRDFSAPFETIAGDLTVRMSVGVVATATPETDAGELVRAAALAMAAASATGRGEPVAFTPGMDASATERLRLAQDLHQAIARDQLRVVFQPLVEVRAGAIVGCEALVRWEQPRRGEIPPDAFIKIAEETGDISAIDTWVLLTACAQVAEWREAGLGDLSVSVNCSGRDLGQGELVDRVEAALVRSGLPSDRLELEITEGAAVAQPGEALAELRQLRRAGVGVAIDDFGTGYSSLSKLATLPVDRIKIDRAFIGEIKRGSDEAPMVAAMIALAHRLNLQVTAEGVETAEQLAFLDRNESDLFQGYLVSEPLDPASFRDLLVARQT